MFADAASQADTRLRPAKGAPGSPPKLICVKGGHPLDGPGARDRMSFARMSGDCGPQSLDPFLRPMTPGGPS